MRSRLVVVAVAVFAGLMVGTPAVAASTTWTLETTPASPNGGGFNAVSCVSGRFCLSVGGADAIFGWNGSTWYAFASPGNSDTHMTGVACTSTTYCIVVGNSYTGSGYTTAAWVWNGANWTTMNTFNPKSSWNLLNAISCLGPSRCEAVGQHAGSSTGSPYPMAEYWNGAKWTYQPTKGAPVGFLDSVSCESPGHCEAVGTDSNSFSSTGNSPLAMGLDGTKWVTQKTPPAVADSVFEGVSCYSKGCIAVGYSEGQAATLADSWSGHNWSAMEDPAATGGYVLNGVHCQKALECTAVGELGAGLVDTWNGQSWTINDTPLGGTLYGLSCTTHECTAVGYTTNDENSLAMRN